MKKIAAVLAGLLLAAGLGTAAPAFADGPPSCYGCPDEDVIRTADSCDEAAVTANVAAYTYVADQLNLTRANYTEATIRAQEQQRAAQTATFHLDALRTIHVGLQQHVDALTTTVVNLNAKVARKQARIERLREKLAAVR